MVYYLIMSRSLTNAQRLSKALERAGISAAIMRPPRDLGQEGCSYCVKLSERWLPDALSILDMNGLSGGKIYALNTDEGSYELMV